MQGCQDYGIVRKNGFLYLSDKPEIHFRGPGSITRDIKYIAPEELADGMLKILQDNGNVEKTALYNLLAKQCGMSRSGKAATEVMEAALRELHGSVNIDNDRISLK